MDKGIIMMDYRLKSFECPTCGVVHKPCDICKENWAEYEAWKKYGILNVRVQICEKCIPQTIAGQAGKTIKDCEE